MFKHELGKVCKPCYLWLLDNYVAVGEKDVKAQILEDGRIILIHGKQETT